MEVERGGPVLYAVDLDGTLLSDDARLSPTSRALLLPLVEEGMPIAVASARSVVAIRKLLAGLPLALPAIEFNGAFLSEVSTGRHLWTCALPAEVAAAILDLARTAGQSPFVSTFDGERDRLYAPPSLNPGMDWYLGERRAATDERLTPVADVAAALADEIVCFTVIGEEAALRDLEGEVRARWDG
ncbi:MAG: HAD hydrolase family protein, partial [Gemmatimonadota bacterium]